MVNDDTIPFLGHLFETSEGVPNIRDLEFHFLGASRAGINDQSFGPLCLPWARFEFLMLA